MKKILALALALVFALALAVPTFAVDPIADSNASSDYNVDLDGGSHAIDVVYNVGGSYIVDVPAGFNVDDYSTAPTVSATNVLIKHGQTLTVAFDSQNGAEGTGEQAKNFKLNYVKTGLQEAPDYIVYKVSAQQGSAEAVAVTDGATILTLVAGTATDGASSATTTLTFDFTDKVNARYQGQYKDQITFTVTVSPDVDLVG